MANEQEQGQNPPEGQTPSPQQEPREQGGRGEERRKREDPRRKRTIRFVLIALLVVAIIVSIPIFAYYSVRESTDDAQIDGHIIPISARITGNIIEVLINDNQQVKAGESLVKLDPADYQVALEQAQAQLLGSIAGSAESKVNVPITRINTRSSVDSSSTQEKQAAAAVNAAIQGVNASRARINSSQATLAQSQANFVKAQKDLERFRSLVAKDEISKQDYDAAVASSDASAAQVDAARAESVQAQHTLDQAIAQVEQAKASLATAAVQRLQSQTIKPRQIELIQARYEQAQAGNKQYQAAVDQAKLNLQYTLLKAPVDGIISRKSAEPGMRIAQGQQLMAIVPLDDIWVTANFQRNPIEEDAATPGSGSRSRHVRQFPHVQGPHR